MDASYERNVTTLIIISVSNIITSTLLDVSIYVKRGSASFYLDRTERKKGIDTPILKGYFLTFTKLVYEPIDVIEGTVVALANLTRGICRGIPYRIHSPIVQCKLLCRL
jgi:hypothetical protein